MKLLITGISGLLGNNLAWHFKDKAEVIGLYHSHPLARTGIRTMAVDLRDYDSVRRLMTAERPEVVIHCASRTDVDGIEEDREGGWQANVMATRVLLDSLRDSGAKVLYISTDSVYPGENGPYSEENVTGPLNWYGKTKLEGEQLVAARSGSLILRTNIFGWNFQNKESLGEWFLNRLQANEKIKGFADARFSSIYTFTLAEIIEQCLAKDLDGIYNCASSDSCAKLDFGRCLADLFGFDQKLIQPAKLTDLSFTAPRGNDLSLDTDKLAKALGRPLPTISENLAAFYSHYQAGIPAQLKRLESGTALLERCYPIRTGIPYGGQTIDDHDIAMVASVLKSPFLTQGPVSEAFEKALEKRLGCSHAVTVSSGTAALHLACLACGISSGDEVITSPNTFVASANCAAYCGARPVFADIDPRTYNITPEEIEKKITPHTRAIIPVHFAGQSCDMAAIANIVRGAEKKYGQKIFIIEDACHALGSRYRDSLIGSCAWSDMTVLSFHPVKHITTGEGGAVLTNNPILDKSIRQLRVHGITNQPADFINKDLGYHTGCAHSETVLNPWYYEQQKLGYNFRITDIQCALGVSQLQKLDLFMARRKSIVAKYNERLGGNRYLQLPYEAPDCDSNFHLYVVLIDFESLGMCRAHFMAALNKEQVYSQVHYIPVHTQPYYQKTFGTGWGDCPNAEAYYERCLSIPLFPSMDDGNIEKVVSTLEPIITQTVRI